MSDACSLFDKSQHESLCCRQVPCRRTELAGRKVGGSYRSVTRGTGRQLSPPGAEGASEHAANWETLHCPARARGQEGSPRRGPAPNGAPTGPTKNREVLIEPRHRGRAGGSDSRMLRTFSTSQHVGMAIDPPWLETSPSIQTRIPKMPIHREPVTRFVRRVSFSQVKSITQGERQRGSA